MKQVHNKPWTVDTKHRGSMNDRTVAIVMNNSADRNNVNKIRVSYFITENPSLLQGNNTVAVFRLKEKFPKINDLNVTNLFTNYLNKKKEPLV